MKRTIILSVLLILPFIVSNTIAQNKVPDFEEVLRNIDQISNFGSDISLTMSMDIKDPEEGDTICSCCLFKNQSPALVKEHSKLMTTFGPMTLRAANLPTVPVVIALKVVAQEIQIFDVLQIQRRT